MRAGFLPDFPATAKSLVGKPGPFDYHSRMQDLTITLPGDSLVGAKIPPREMESELRRRLAAALFSDGTISGAAACRMSGMQKAEFQFWLGERKIPQPIDWDDCLQDLEQLEEWKGR